MRCRIVRAPHVALVGLFAVGVFLNGHAAARDATPPPAATAITVVDLAPGVTAEVFAGVPSDRAPGQTLYLARFVFQPGGEIFPHSHPGTVALGVAEGRFGWTLVAGRASVLGAPPRALPIRPRRSPSPGPRSSSIQATPSSMRTTSSTPHAAPARSRRWSRGSCC